MSPSEFEPPAAGPARRRRWPIVLAGFAGFAALMAGVSLYLLSSWSRIERSDARAAARAFQEALDRLGDNAPYIEIAGDGTVKVHRELEAERPAAIRTLHLLAWDPASSRLLRVAFPFWFVRLKMSAKMNLGTLTTALAGDWGHMDLSVAEEELRRRGPGLVLDESRGDGGRLLLWTD